MENVYQLTFFLALGILAVVVTIFVFAVSLLGRAMEDAAKREKAMKAEMKAKNAKEIAFIKKELEESQAKGKIPRGLTRKLNRLLKRDRKFEKELSKTRRAPELLTVKGGVVHPGAFLGTALILTGVASHLSSIEIPTVPVIIWGLGLAAIVYSIRRIYLTLKVVEGTAITSEQETFAREKEVLIAALRKHETGRKPALKLIFQDEKPPLHIKANSTITIEFGLDLTRGIEMGNPRVIFYAPPGFNFPGHKTYKQGSTSGLPNYITTAIKSDCIYTGIVLVCSLNLRAPTEPKPYVLFYRMTGTSYSSKRLNFEVIVE